MALDHHRIVWVSVADLLATEDGADWIDPKQAGRFKMAVVHGMVAMSRRGLPVSEKEMQHIMEEHDGTYLMMGKQRREEKYLAARSRLMLRSADQKAVAVEPTARARHMGRRCTRCVRENHLRC